MSDGIRIEPPAVLRLRRAILHAAPPPATVDERAWRRRRDDLLDEFEAGTAAQVAPDRLRDALDLLAEGTPSGDSRLSGREWEREVTAVMDELMALLHS